MNVKSKLTMLTLGASLAVGLLACAGNQRTQLSGSAIVPAAEGEVHTRKIENGNFEINVKVKHLALPEKLMDGATTYVVWLLPSGQDTRQNIGALQVDKDLVGSLTATTPHSTFLLSITAEPFGGGAVATGPVAFTTTIRGE